MQSHKEGRRCQCDESPGRGGCVTPPAAPRPSDSRSREWSAPRDGPRPGPERGAAGCAGRCPPAASASMARNSGSRTWKEQEAVSRIPPGARHAHGAEVDLAIAAERGRHRAAGLGEGRGIEDDGVEPLARPGEGAQRLEGVALAPLDVAEPVERGVGRPALERLRARVERQHAAGAAAPGGGRRSRGRRSSRARGRPAPPARRPAGGWDADRGRRRSSGRPRARRGSACRLRGPRSRAARCRGPALPPRPSPSRRRTAASFRSRIPSGAKHARRAPRRSAVAHRLEAGREDLHHQPAVVAVDDQRGQRRRPRRAPAGRRSHRCRARRAALAARRSRHQARVHRRGRSARAAGGGSPRRGSAAPGR